METNKTNKHSFKEAVESMKPEIERQFGEAAEEIHKIIEIMGGIDESMKEMREESKESETRIMDAIKSEKNQEINDLKL
jgi:2-hydroxy-3-keto-5-methylthiopentenyl-1-phosphate phosphatase